MHLGLRLFFAFAAITGLAAFFVLRVFVTEIKPSVAEVMEDTLVDAANLLAEVAAPELRALALDAAASPAGAGVPASLPPTGALATAVRAYTQREIDAPIGSLRKTTLDLRVIATDTTGRVMLDTGTPAALGEDYARWRDVARTLRGEYGARMSRDENNPGHSVMVVAAPVRDPAAGGRVIGALVLAKPMATIAPFVERAERKVLGAGVLLLGASAAIGVVVTLWAVHAVRRLRGYALAVAERADDDAVPAPPVPALQGELGELARAMDQMRRRLEGRDHLEHGVRALTHELKSPLTAIRGAAELLREPLPDDDRLRFVQQVDDACARLQAIVEQMLALSKLESLHALPRHAPVDLALLTDGVIVEQAAALAHKRLVLHWLERDGGAIEGDAALLTLALSNLLVNATAAAPEGSTLELAWRRDSAGGDAGAAWTLRDHGPGVPAAVLARLGERFFSAAAFQPAGDGPAARRGSGLGLAIVRRVAALHGAALVFERAEPGLRVRLRFADSSVQATPTADRQR